MQKGDLTKKSSQNNTPTLDVFFSSVRFGDVGIILDNEKVGKNQPLKF
jgi:hypothetical protein